MIRLHRVRPVIDPHAACGFPCDEVRVARLQPRGVEHADPELQVLDDPALRRGDGVVCVLAQPARDGLVAVRTDERNCAIDEL